MVVLPDYQGIGIGSKLLSVVAKEYAKQGYDFSIVTSAKNLIKSLKHKKEWTMIRYSATQPSSKKSAIDYKRATVRQNCKTASFYYNKA